MAHYWQNNGLFLCILDYTELPFPLKALLCVRNRSPKQLMASSPIDVRDDLYGQTPISIITGYTKSPSGHQWEHSHLSPPLPPPHTSENRLHSTDTQSLSSLGQEQQHRQCKFLHNCCKKAAACTVPSKAFGYAAATSACTSAPLSLAGPLKNLSKYNAFY